MIYNNIKKICKQKKMSVRSIEQRAGLSNGAISKWNISRPSIDHLQAVAKVMDVPLDKIIEEKGGE